MTTVSYPKNSTIVRTQSLAVRATRAGLRMLSPHAPDLAARWAERLFMTPRRFVRPSWEADILASATEGRVAYDGGWIPTWTWNPAPAGWAALVDEPQTVLLVHGWEGRGSQLGAFVAPLLERGLRVVTFDAAGHGDSSLPLGSIVEHARSIMAVAHTLGPIHGVIGHSVGGAAALFATRLGLDARRFALVSPPTSPSQFAAAFARTLGIDDALKGRMISRLEARYDMPFDDIDATLDASRLEAPLLVVHDHEDPIVRFEQGKTLAQLADHGTLIETRGLGHRAILRAPEVVDAVVRFVGQDVTTSRFAETLEGELFVRDRRHPRRA